ncbi:MAG TPA: flavodoxin-dependent (E)-4-hydroxy-3-methylbut-2-enyl-diphosphate synthase [bacterium]|nr:flavodoxin-dependent (E)-4-hydroxy-3-methylbut-2-enyl-diphosphate synthase [bacterium]
MKKTRCVRIGNVYIGGNAPISVQTMTKVPTSCTEELIKQIKRIQNIGGEIVRVSVLNKDDIVSIGKMKNQRSIPLVADIHYDYKLALGAIDAGVDKIRVNPSNISKNGMQIIIKKAMERKIPVRLGLNSGSIKRSNAGLVIDIVNAAMDSIKLCEDMGFFDMVISLKTPYVKDTVTAYRVISQKCNYPLHLGVTEAGSGYDGFAKNALGIGMLLSEGIGNTIRVSLTDTPENEVKAGCAILQALQLRRFYPEIISCPVCGRCQISLENIVPRFKNKIMKLSKKYPGIRNLTIAIMGCGVNGPGEAKQADIGIAGGKDRFALFVKGRIIKTYSIKQIEKEFFSRLKEMAGG